MFFYVSFQSNRPKKIVPEALHLPFPIVKDINIPLLSRELPSEGLKPKNKMEATFIWKASCFYLFLIGCSATIVQSP